MEETNQRIEELEKKIKEWQEELKMWENNNGASQDIGIQKSELRRLIENAKEEIKNLEQEEISEDNIIIEDVVEENIEIEKDPEELLKEIKEEKETAKEAEHQKEVEMKNIDRRIERLEKEIEIQESEKNLGYKAVIEESEKQIEELKRRKEEIEKAKEKQSEISKEEKIKILTRGKNESEKAIRDIELEIRKKQIEAQEAIRDSEMEEKELSNGEKTKIPKVLGINEEIKQLKEEIRRQQGLIEEYDINLEELKGITINKGAQEASERNYEETIRYLHGQGDLREDKKDDRRANDEFFGLERVEQRNNENNGQKENDDDKDNNNNNNEKDDDKDNNDNNNEKDDDKDNNNNNDEKDNAIARSGLQVYREIFNAGGEPEGKNLWGYGRISEFPVVGPFARGLGKFFGSGKYVKETYNNIKELSESDYNLLAEYLTEEKIVELKVPMPILDALRKRHREIQNKVDKENKQKLDEIQEKLDDAKRTNDEELIIKYGKEKEKIINESELIQNNMKNINRGLEHRSFRQRDNYTYFGKRQPNNKKEINELADIDLERLEAEKNGNTKETILAKEKMEEYMHENTDIGKKLKFIPYDTGKFRKPKDEIVTKVSDRRETRPQTYFYLALGTIGAIKSAITILKDHELMEQMYKTVQEATGNVTPEMAQNTINSVVNDMNSINGMKEYANLEGNNWDISSGKYQVADASHHGFMEQFGQGVVNRISNIRNMCQTDPTNAMIEAYKLKKEVISNVPADQLQVVVKQHTQFWNGLPQNMQEVFANDAQTGKDAAMNLCDMMINGINKTKNLTNISKPGKIDLWGPIISAGATIGSFINNRRQGNISKNQKQEKDQDQNQR